MHGTQRVADVALGLFKLCPSFWTLSDSLTNSPSAQCYTGLATDALAMGYQGYLVGHPGESPHLLSNMSVGFPENAQFSLGLCNQGVQRKAVQGRRCGTH